MGENAQKGAKRRVAVDGLYVACETLRVASDFVRVGIDKLYVACLILRVAGASGRVAGDSGHVAGASGF